MIVLAEKATSAIQNGNKVEFSSSSLELFSDILRALFCCVYATRHKGDSYRIASLYFLYLFLVLLIKKVDFHTFMMFQKKKNLILFQIKAYKNNNENIM